MTTLHSDLGARDEWVFLLAQGTVIPLLAGHTSTREQRENRR